ncbi:MAG: hypothetical protein PHR28_14280 [candidate division Zixibacteria bacterium]|jgi:hypothetical protein|nr:hypothetical protein [candidate division Zixibacteria bacterium]
MEYHITKIVGYVVDASSEKEAEQIVRENELENPLAYFSKLVPFQFEDAVRAFDRSQIVHVGDTIKLPNEYPYWGRYAEVTAVTEIDDDETALEFVCRKEIYETTPLSGSIYRSMVKLCME